METPQWALHATRVAVLSGAGISTASGIPDYRGPQGVWTRDPAAAAAFTLETYLSDAQTRKKFWQTYANHPTRQAKPNPAHEALARLDRSGVAVRVLTQNITACTSGPGSPGVRCWSCTARCARQPVSLVERAFRPRRYASGSPPGSSIRDARPVAAFSSFPPSCLESGLTRR